MFYCSNIFEFTLEKNLINAKHVINLSHNLDHWEPMKDLTLEKSLFNAKYVRHPLDKLGIWKSMKKHMLKKSLSNVKLAIDHMIIWMFWKGIKILINDSLKSSQRLPNLHSSKNVSEIVFVTFISCFYFSFKMSQNCEIAIQDSQKESKLTFNV